MIPAAVHAWVQDRLDAPVLAIDPVPGGITDSVFAVRRAAGDPVILRYLEVDRWGTEGRRHVTSEARACRLLDGSDVPAPHLVAADPDAVGSGGYANLTSFRPGRVRLDALGPAAVDELARLAVTIHQTPADPADPHPAYAFWAPADLTVPTWAAHPDLWRRAIEIFRGGPPATPAGLLHRDFHPGNILWQGDRITGVIDWAETSWGPADLDVAHCRTNFVLLHDLDRADAFVAAYRQHGGRLDPDPDAARFWTVADVLGFLPDPAVIVRALTRTAPELTPAVIRARLEALLELTLQPQ